MEAPSAPSREFSGAADPESPFPPRRWVRGLILALLLLKLSVSAWNAFATHPRTYDLGNHIERAVHAPLHLGRYSYDPPLYYVAPYVVKAIGGDEVDTRQLVLAMRVENLLLLAATYLAWIYGIIPRLFRDWRQGAVASVVLLALPTYQKIAQVAHPDNLHHGLASIALALWFHLWAAPSRGEDIGRRRYLGWLVALAIAIGASGMTRPFAAVTVLVVWVSTLLSIWLRAPLDRRAKLTSALLVTVIAGTLSSAWYAYRWVETGKITGTYNAAYIKRYAKYREDFDYPRYFTTFYFTDLLEEPNRNLVALDDEVEDFHYNKYGNSFFTIAYSEAWGDHWLYFSGKAERKVSWSVEEKRWPKRIVFLLGLPLTIFLVVRFFASSAYVLREAARDWRSAVPQLMLLVYFCLGLALYLWWQTGDGLTPGKNSSIKASYNAYLIALAVTIPFFKPLSARVANIVLLWSCLLAGASLPLILFWTY